MRKQPQTLNDPFTTRELKYYAHQPPRSQEIQIEQISIFIDLSFFVEENDPYPKRTTCIQVI